MFDWRQEVHRNQIVISHTNTAESLQGWEITGIRQSKNSPFAFSLVSITAEMHLQIISFRAAARQIKQ